VLTSDKKNADYAFKLFCTPVKLKLRKCNVINTKPEEMEIYSQRGPITQQPITYKLLKAIRVQVIDAFPNSATQKEEFLDCSNR
jgi:hypothetical protein